MIDDRKGGQQLLDTKKESKKNDKIKFASYYYDMQKDFDKLYDDSKNNKSIKNLIEIISKEDNIMLAYRNLKTNKGSHTRGTDDKDIKFFENMKYDEIIKYVRNRLKNFQSSEVRRVWIPKGNGKMRPLGIPTIGDRLIQQCIKQVLEPICEAKFYEHSYGFRPNRDSKHALFRIQHLINNSQLHYCIDVDIKSFFDEIDHGKLIKQIWSMGIKDKRLLKILSNMLKCKVDGTRCIKGTPQGGILSPLLANIVLNELDWWVASQYDKVKLRDSDKYSRGWYFSTKKKSNLKEMYIVRYADDFKIICRDYVTCVKMLESLKKWLKERLKLRVSNEKTKIINLRKNFSYFVGIKIKAKKGKKNKFYATSRVDDKRVIEIKKTLKIFVKAIQRFKDKRSVDKFNIYVLGLHNYFSRATNVMKDFKVIDYSVRRTQFSRLKNIAKYGYHVSGSENLNEKYFNKRSYKTWKLCKTPLIPVVDINYKTNVAFKKERCDYTTEGRKLLNYKDLGMRLEIMLIKNQPLINESVELRDNKISRYSMQKGKCGVTGVELHEREKELHHIQRRADGGSDKFSNVIWLLKDVHRLVHAKRKTTITELLKIIKSYETINKKFEEKVNELRVKSNNSKINLSEYLI